MIGARYLPLGMHQQEFESGTEAKPARKCLFYFASALHILLRSCQPCPTAALTRRSANLIPWLHPRFYTCHIRGIRASVSETCSRESSAQLKRTTLIANLALPPTRISPKTTYSERNRLRNAAPGKEVRPQMYVGPIVAGEMYAGPPVAQIASQTRFPRASQGSL